jgi:hypothetical protein
MLLIMRTMVRSKETWAQIQLRWQSHRCKELALHSFEPDLVSFVAWNRCHLDLLPVVCFRQIHRSKCPPDCQYRTPKAKEVEPQSEVSLPFSRGCQHTQMASRLPSPNSLPQLPNDTHASRPKVDSRRCRTNANSGNISGEMLSPPEKSMIVASRVGGRRLISRSCSVAAS